VLAKSAETKSGVAETPGERVALLRAGRSTNPCVIPVGDIAKRNFGFTFETL
jgi:hypothetical protein